MWGIVVHQPVNPGLLFEYHLKKKSTLLKRDQFYKNLNSVNKVLQRYEDSFPKLKQEILETEQKIQDCTKGIPSEGRDNSSILDDDTGVQENRAVKFLCKKYYKSLAQVLHPDKPSGNAEEFRTICEALKNNDLDYLRITYMVKIKEANLFWKCSEGREIWLDLLEGIRVRTSRLQATEPYAILRLHLQGHTTLAKSKTKVLLLRKLLARQQELKHLILKGTRNG